MKFNDDLQFDDEAARAWYERMVRQVLEHPPTCLQGFETRSIPPADDFWDDRTTWNLACPCGNGSGQILGYSLKEFREDYEGPLMFVTPLAFRCSACRKTTEIIDTDLHGYDGECKARFGGYGAATYRGTGERAIYTCRECKNTAFHVTACFQYSHFDIIEDEPELESVAQDFFDWFDCGGVCTSCGIQQSIGDYELA